MRKPHIQGTRPEIEIAWIFNRAYHGHAYATKAADAVMEFAFTELQTARLYALIDRFNAPSIALANRLPHALRSHHPRVQARLDALRAGTDVKVKLGAVWHFSLAVEDPEKTAQFWTTNFDLKEMFRSDEGIGLTNDAIIIGFFKGTPHPDTIDHVSFHVDTMRALRDALATLKKNGVNLEDPDDEIGHTAPGSPHMGLWFHDPDGYRWELSVQNGATER